MDYVTEFFETCDAPIPFDDGKDSELSLSDVDKDIVEEFGFLEVFGK